MRDVRAALLAGGLGERMGRLTDGTCKPLVPHAGSCRLVDFSVRNAVASGIPELVLLSMHRERDLIDHLARHWDGAGIRVHFGPHDELVRSGTLESDALLPARPAERGTADALLSNADYLFAPGATDILVQHADHVYDYGYGPMLAAHRETGADVTIGVQRIERQFVRLFGMVEVDPQLRVQRLEEKPANPTSDLIFTAFCLFHAESLRTVLDELCGRGEQGWQHDISRDVLPAMIDGGYRVLAHPIEGYWADIGTVERYHLEHLKLLNQPHPLPPERLPHTLPGRPAHYIPELRSLVGGHPPVDARVRDSVVFVGSVVEPGAVVERSVVLPGARVRAGVQVWDAVVAEGEDLTSCRTGLSELTPRSNGGHR